MSAVRIACTACERQLTLKSREKLGSRLRCPECGEAFIAKEFAPEQLNPESADGDEFGAGDFLDDLGEMSQDREPSKPRNAGGSSGKRNSAGKKGAKKRSRKSSGPRTGVLIGGAVAGALLLGGGVWAIFALSGFGKPDDNDLARNAADTAPNSGDRKPGAEPGENDPQTKTGDPKPAAKQNPKPGRSKESFQQVKAALDAVAAKAQQNPPGELSDKQKTALVAECEAAVGMADDFLKQPQPNEIALIPALYHAASAAVAANSQGAEAESAVRLIERVWERSDKSAADYAPWVAYSYELLGDDFRRRGTAKTEERRKLYETAVDMLKPAAAGDQKPAQAEEYAQKIQNLQRKLSELTVAGNDPGPKDGTAKSRPSIAGGNITTFSPGDEPLPVDKALAGKMTLKLDDAPLVDALFEFSKASKLQILLDLEALAQENVRTETPLKLNASNQPASDALDAMLKSTELEWAVRHGVVLVTTKIEAEQLRETRVYQVRGDVNKLPGVVVARAPGPWLDVDGIGGVVAPAGSRMVLIRQTRSSLNEIERVFSRELKRVALPDVSVKFKLQRGTFPTGLMKQNVELLAIDEPLNELLATLAEKSGVTFTVNAKSLAEEGVKPTTAVSLHLRGLRVLDMLNLVLESYHLSWRLTADGNVEIVDQVAAESTLVAAQHSVDAPLENHTVRALVQATSRPWAAIDGVGGSLRAAGKTTLHINHTIGAQLECARLLSAFRKDRD